MLISFVRIFQSRKRGIVIFIIPGGLDDKLGCCPYKHLILLNLKQWFDYNAVLSPYVDLLDLMSMDGKSRVFTVS